MTKSVIISQRYLTIDVKLWVSWLVVLNWWGKEELRSRVYIGQANAGKGHASMDV